ncbi:hypothetical protein [Acinetobacter guillouiae]|uniref:hypothetical protein n=1 Tax=Acinetobacter guillouiae TaxID=106649 RepID=UPI0028EF4A6C|nr:hypothetical protein [Acinetobacter guillouiae]
MKFFITLLLLFFLTSCSSHWVSETGNNHDLKGSEDYCSRLAQSEYPVQNEVGVRTKNEDVLVRCSRNEKNCKDSTFETRPKIESYVIDVNADSRYYYFKVCMREHGWKREYRIIKKSDIF